MYEPPNASKDSMHSIVEKTQINRLEEKFNSFLKFRITNSVLNFKIRMSTKASVQVDACGDLQLKQFHLKLSSDFRRFHESDLLQIMKSKPFNSNEDLTGSSDWPVESTLIKRCFGRS